MPPVHRREFSETALDRQKERERERGVTITADRQTEGGNWLQWILKKSTMKGEGRRREGARGNEGTEFHNTFLEERARRLTFVASTRIFRMIIIIINIV